MAWHRLTIVASKRCGWLLTNKNNVFVGGSSNIFSKALADAIFSVSAGEINTMRRAFT